MGSFIFRTPGPSLAGPGGTSCVSWALTLDPRGALAPCWACDCPAGWSHGPCAPAAAAAPRPQGCLSGPPAESAYTKVRHFEGETLSVLCSYKGYRNRVDGKVWCKIRRRKCEPGFTRVWVEGPRYLLQDDAQAKVVNITMAALTLQDSGRYWCMRNSSGTLYPMLGIWLDVSPVGDSPRTVAWEPRYFIQDDHFYGIFTVTITELPSRGLGILWVWNLSIP
uniref:Trem-like transcript 2 protein n=1 Tax=Callithrix jacchus TaxID=9483 RepID=A0A5F4VV88_CALJA